jgi:hypothetical protein
MALLWHLIKNRVFAEGGVVPHDPHATARGTSNVHLSTD